MSYEPGSGIPLMTPWASAAASSGLPNELSPVGSTPNMSQVNLLPGATDIGG